MLQAAAPVQRIAGSSQPVGAKLAANWTFRGDGLTDAIDRICDFAIAFAFIRNPATSSVLSCLVPSLGEPMRRRSGAGGEPIKTRRRKAMTLKRRIAPKTVRRRGPSTIELQEQLELCTRELNETREREGATSEVLRVISRSSGEFRPVFDAILDNAVRICGAQNANLWLQTDGALRRAARHRDVPNPIAPAQPSAKSILVRAVRTKQIIHVADYIANQAYLDGDPFTVAAVEELGVRTYVAVPMLKESDLVGAISVYRTEVRAFTEKQIALLTSFAAQAVIALENTRLLNELRERTDDLTEALGQQTATSEVLQVISSSPGELEPVFKAMLENATRICDAKFGVLQLLEGDGFRAVALHNAPPAFADYVQRGLLRPGPNVPLSRMARTKQVVHIADITMEEAYISAIHWLSPVPTSAAIAPSLRCQCSRRAS